MYIYTWSIYIYIFFPCICMYVSLSLSLSLSLCVSCARPPCTAGLASLFGPVTVLLEMALETGAL